MAILVSCVFHCGDLTDSKVAAIHSRALDDLTVRVGQMGAVGLLECEKLTSSKLDTDIAKSMLNEIAKMINPAVHIWFPNDINAEQKIIIEEIKLLFVDAFSDSKKEVLPDVRRS